MFELKVATFSLDASFLRATAATAVARLSHRNSVCPSVTRVDQSKTVEARITKSSPSPAWKTLVSGTVKLFHKFKGNHPKRGC